MVHATDELLVLGDAQTGALGGTGMEGVGVFGIVVRWDVELIEKVGPGSSGGAEGGAGVLGVVIVCRGLGQAGGVGLYGQQHGRCEGSSCWGFGNATCGVLNFS